MMMTRVTGSFVLHSQTVNVWNDTVVWHRKYARAIGINGESIRIPMASILYYMAGT